MRTSIPVYPLCFLFPSITTSRHLPISFLGQEGKEWMVNQDPVTQRTIVQSEQATEPVS